MVRRILVAFRFSEAGQAALRLAAGFARVHGAWLHIFHALNYRLMHPETSDDVIIRMTREAETRFEKEYRGTLRDVTHWGFNCWEADPAVEVVKLARETGADLIVLGCHEVGDRPGIARLGMVGLAIAQTAPCPVLLVPCLGERKKEGANP